MNINKHIPNLITLGNLSFGFAAIAQSFSGTFDSLCAASYFIFLAAFMDLMDGFVARMLNVTSDIGKQLDSLADVVSFGVAPGFILFQILNHNLTRATHFDEPIRYWVYLSVIIPVASAYRLAKFNTDSSQTNHFKGMPTPAMAIVVACIPLQLMQDIHAPFSQLLLSSRFVTALIVMLALLMVSNIPMFSFKPQNGGLSGNWHILTLLASMVVLFVFMGFAAGILAVLFYPLLSFLYFRMQPPHPKTKE
jgi:CDP-diacylglycerol--serine O-phosphatidyltransferase